jgi:hypothetical protein
MSKKYPVFCRVRGTLITSYKFRAEHLKLIEVLNGPIVRSEVNSLSRASSLSVRSRRSNVRNISRQEVVNNIFQRRQSSAENTTDMVELQDIVIQEEL